MTMSTTTHGHDAVMVFGTVTDTGGDTRRTRRGEPTPATPSPQGSSYGKAPGNEGGTAY
jgi:hypothetical protein